MVRITVIICSLILQPLHGCGLALICLKQPYQHTAGLQQTYLLLEKQRNRGQDGAGMALITRDQNHAAVIQICSADRQPLEKLGELLIEHQATAAQIFMGHVRYGTYAGTGTAFCQPVISSNTTNHLIALAGNFNMTNIDELRMLMQPGRDLPASDTGVLFELFNYYLSRNIDIFLTLEKIMEQCDGGYVLAGALSTGDVFVCRDPHGIRTAFYYEHSNSMVVASERAAIATVFSGDLADIHELPAGSVLMISPDGSYTITQCAPVPSVTACSFERIYFSRGNDPAIMAERKALGRELAPRVLEALDGDLEQAIFTYVPNSSELAFTGLIEELHRLTGAPVRTEKIIYKDQLMRTFIAHEGVRSAMAAHAYDLTRGIVTPEDTLVILDDSIVRGTTIKNLMADLITLNPHKIVLVSSAPPVLYPDCYGIDMSCIDTFIAFQAARALLPEIDRCATGEPVALAELYGCVPLEALEKKIAELVYPTQTPWCGELTIVYQTIQGLHRALPNHGGDWYFTGNYPTPGGYRVLKNSILHWYYGVNTRAY